jgi:hypothetical protein
VLVDETEDEKITIVVNMEIEDHHLPLESVRPPKMSSRTNHGGTVVPILGEITWSCHGPN